MSLLGKRGPKGPHQHEIHTRRQYVDHSMRFLNWVNDLGLEKSPLGRFAYFLDRQFHIRSVSLLFLFCIGLSGLMFYDIQMMSDYSVGEIAPADIKSPMDLVIIDEVATEEKRNEAEKSLPIILDYESDIFEAVYGAIYQSFYRMRVLMRENPLPESGSKRDLAVKDFLRHKPEFTKLFLGKELSDYLFEWLVENRFSAKVENILVNGVLRWSKERIIDTSSDFLSNPDRSIIVRDIKGANKGSEYNLKARDIINMRDISVFHLEGLRGYNLLSEKDKTNVTQLARLLLIPNLNLNKQEFSDRQKKVRESVLPVQLSIKKNQTIVTAGSPVQPLHLTILGEIRNVRSEKRTDFMSLFTALLFVALILTFYSFLRRYARQKIKVEKKDIVVMGFTLVLIVVLTRLFTYVFDVAVVDKYGEFIPQLAYYVAAPVAAGAMLIGLLIKAVEIVWVYSIFVGIVMAVMANLNLPFFIVSIVGGIAAARGVHNCNTRNDIYWAGLRAGAVSAIAASLIYGLSHVGEPNLLRGMLWCVAGGLIGGLSSSLTAMSIVPLLESAFNYTTDIKLLELSSLNHPLMQEMMMKSPGTYHHAMNVGSLSDAAAKEVGANPLLAKVMAYYHDIGKMEHSQYFIENQRPGYNPHDQISPHMSKTILIAHVKDGAEMAIRYKLGKPIVDGILQHHGTTLISFFYNKALEEQEADVTGVVDESDFRYPGPKPQFKEAAIVMLADSIEATARALEEPTQGRLNSIVENIVESKFMDHQLDECNLTIQNLAVIKDTFKRVLLSMYHHRLDYPHMRDGKVVVVPHAKKNGSGKRA